ncbi:conserved Plasmodium protein, unknown function [Plasmodium gallinaceum]|uniref:Uncharacterized protein n=1 Tax=Plasmodium gallinaceum TaxID=5849 RepID=A0A1J1H2V4_PLAGA|nr:conserved Plasmodium protein, unknown function [Plasmodium gallinaceum]CRG97820.1 conserved Plasmodium protein, unknown function [Plasmodium gallinaceum]
MDEKKKNFYNYVDNMHKKNEEIHKTMQIKEKLKKEEQKKIEESEEVMKKNDIYMSNVDNINKNKELSYVNLERELSIQKNKLQNLKSLLSELPDAIDKEDEKYKEFKKKSYREINELMNTLESSIGSRSIDEMWDKIKECHNNTEKLNNAIQETYSELSMLNEKYYNSKDEFRDLVELEKNKKKKLKKISVTLQFIQNLKQGVGEKTNNENDLKKKLEEINDLYK